MGYKQSREMSHSVLLAIVLPESAEVSMNFVEMVITLQRNLARGQCTPVQIEFVNSVERAIDLFLTTKHTRLAVMDGDMGCDVSFIQKDHPFPIVISSYPIRQVDWERVSSYITTQREMGKEPTPDGAKAEGCIYNFEAASSSCLSSTYLPVKKAQAKIVNLGREAVKDFLRMYDKSTKTVVSPGSNDVVVDLSTVVKNPGPYDFEGVVGRRLVQNTTPSVPPAPPAPPVETDPLSISYV